MPVIAFVVAATDAGPMIVNRYDVHYIKEGYFGVGAEVLQTGSFGRDEIAGITTVLELRHAHHGDGVVVFDVGANIGTHTMTWGKAMQGWGEVIAIEAQERVYYALAGNVAMNNLFNVRAIHAAAGETDGTLMIPQLDHTKPASFGSLELRPLRASAIVSGQPIGQDPVRRTEVRMVMLDSIAPARVDMIKIDVEGMELDVLAGAVETIVRCHPVLFVEWPKTGGDALRDWLKGHDYAISQIGANLLAIHRQDPIRDHLVIQIGDKEKGPEVSPGA